MTKPKLHALLVGVNTYDSRSMPPVPSLGGTHQDVDSIKTFLNDQLSSYFQQVHCKVLKDAEATYTNLVHSFYNELCQKAEQGDTVLFFFSGHGSYQPSAKELWPFSDSKRTDETLVCYDSRRLDHYDLTDKEIAVLLSLIKPGVDIIILIDSCFSGSITRAYEKEVLAPGEKARHLPRSKTSRVLHDYFNKPLYEEKSLPLALQNYYVKLQEKGQLHIPGSRHIVITACTREQKAYENIGGGYFTMYLLKILNKQISVTYVALFQRLRSLVQRANERKQTPTFEVFGGFNTQQFFLQQTASNSVERYQVEYHNQQWKMYYGALFGLELSEEEKIWLQIFPASLSTSSEQSATPLPERALVKELHMNYSVLDFEGQNPLVQNQLYQAQIISLPKPKLRIYCNNKINSNAVEAFMQDALARPILWGFTTQPEEANYELIFDESIIQRQGVDNLLKELRIQHVQSGKFIYGIKYPDFLALEPIHEKIIARLNHIEKWNRLLNVERTDSDLAKVFYWALEILDDAGNVQHIIEDKEITLVVPPKGTPVNIVVQNRSARNLYLSCFNFMQENPDSENKPRKGYQIDNLHHFQDFFLAPGDTARVFPSAIPILADAIPDSFIRLKMVASTESIAGYLYQELAEGFSLGYEELDKNAEQGKNRYLGMQFKDDWLAENLNLRVVKAQAIQQNDIASGNVRILQNDGLNTKVNIGYLGVPGGQSKAVQGLQQALEQKDLGLQGFSDPAYWAILGNQTCSTIELNDLPPGNLPQALQIQVDRPADSDSEGLPIPVAYDEENDLLLPFGKLVDTGQQTHIEIQTLPDAGEDRSRSLGRAVIFGLLKMNLKWDLSSLRLVDYSREPLSYIYDFQTIKTRVKEASKILLIVHGFLGNTRQEAEAFRDAVNAQYYDLVLTFEYENLNSTVIEIANKLHCLLCDKKEGMDLGHEDGKELSVVAHSLGGLVARYWVEHLMKGQDTVDQMVLIGVPNVGSAWGKTNDWINFFNASIALLINLSTAQFKSALGKLQKLIGAANTDESLKTLSEMKPNSDILNVLANSAPPVHTKYVLIAGNAIRLAQEVPQLELNRPLLARIGAKLAKLWFKLGYTVGNWFYTEQTPHDCFASVESQLSLPFEPAAKHTIPAHHYGYFEHSATEEASIISIILTKP